jgi:hypothetical protein
MLKLKLIWVVVGFVGLAACGGSEAQSFAPTPVVSKELRELRADIALLVVQIEELEQQVLRTDVVLVDLLVAYRGSLPFSDVSQCTQVVSDTLGPLPSNSKYRIYALDLACKAEVNEFALYGVATQRVKNIMRRVALDRVCRQVLEAQGYSGINTINSNC